MSATATPPSRPATPYPTPTSDAGPDAGARQVDALVEGARRGDGEAFAHLYERFHGQLFRYLLVGLGDRSEAEDMASEVFVEAARRVRAFKGDGAGFAGWLFTIARHDLQDRGRARRRRIVEPVADPPEVGTAPDPADLVADRLDAARVRGALAELTPDQREVLLLKFAAGLSNEEAAVAVGKPVGSVKSLQHRGLAALRRALEGGR